MSGTHKLYITGPVGSGKSTLARRIARDHGYTCVELDSVVYRHDAASPSGNRKRPPEERDALLEEMLSGERWVAEDAGRDAFLTVMQRADVILLLDFPARVRKRRILLRWVKQRLGLEKCGYIPDVKMLRLMFKWTREYDAGMDGLAARLAAFGSKVVRVTCGKDVRAFVASRIGRR